MHFATYRQSHVKQKQTTNESGYTGILKYTGVFGGVQSIVSLITLLKVAVVSRLLGPSGVGIVDVYNRAIDLGKRATDLGISYSAVQSISEQCGENEEEVSMEYAIKVVRSWSLWLAIFGTLLFLLLAPLLSRWSFDGDTAHTDKFRILSLTIGCFVLMGGEMAVLKGTRILGRVAWIQLISAIVMLAVAAPCYYIMGASGIVPSLLFSAVGLLATTCWHSFKVFPYQVALFSRRIIVDGLYIIRQGINYTIAGLLSSGAFYLISIYIFDQGNAAEVGCYSYGNLLISYLSMLVFAALDSEFFPRLSAANKDYQRSNHIVNSQVEILMVLITPLIVCFAVCLPFLSQLLFDAQFMPLIEMTQLGVTGLLFKAMMHPTAYLSLSKGESHIFLLQESLSYIFMAAVMIGGFKYYGLKGLGVGMLLSNMFDWISVWLIATIRYKFSYSRRVCHLLMIQLPILAVMLAICMYTQSWTYVCCGILIIAYSVLYTIRFLYRNTELIHRLLIKAHKKVRFRN